MKPILVKLKTYEDFFIQNIEHLSQQGINLNIVSQISKGILNCVQDYYSKRVQLYNLQKDLKKLDKIEQLYPKDLITDQVSAKIVFYAFFKIKINALKQIYNGAKFISELQQVGQLYTAKGYKEICDRLNLWKLRSIMAVYKNTHKSNLHNQEVQVLKGDVKDTCNSTLTNRSLALTKDRSIRPIKERIKIIKCKLKEELDQCKEEKIITISSSFLAMFPTAILSFVNLRALSFKNNDLFCIPHAVNNFSQLVFLNLTNNRFKEFPKSVCFLKHLQCLILNGNEIEKIPHEIKNLNHLIDLRLAKNQLKDFPKEAISLYSLEHLILNDNLITEIPRDVGKMTSLRQLTIFNNPIKNIADELLQTKQLEIIRLDPVVLFQIYKAISNCPGLAEYAADWNNKRKTVEI
ncbi:MAG: hypothetical protein K0S74_1580 [Chlamydiales bacterium]|jgi:hypothetical protein|nr:hypothetical protein [Chlamydiales bacterium]